MILVIGEAAAESQLMREKVALECQKRKRHSTWQPCMCSTREGKKVERHKRMRAGKGFVTIEQPTDIMRVPSRTSGGRWRRGCSWSACRIWLPMKCLTRKNRRAVSRSRKRLSRRLACWRRRRKNLSLSPTMCLRMASSGDTSTMEYLRALGSINVRLAERSDVVVEVIAGIPVARKGKLPVAAAEKQGHRQKASTGMSVIKSFYSIFDLF